MSRKIGSLSAWVLCLFFALGIGVKAHDPSYEIVAVSGSPPTVDGVIDSQEWSDASSVSFNETTVLVKQDGLNLYIAFNMSYSPFLPYDAVSVFIDVDDDGGLTLQPDDIALIVLVSGSLMETNVTGGVWTLTDVIGWSAETQSNLDTWHVEFNITYSKIDVGAGDEKSVGAFFMSTYAVNIHYYWPPTIDYGDYESPSEWGGITSTGYSWIPELQSFLILPLFMIVSVLVVTIHRVLKRNTHSLQS